MNTSNRIQFIQNFSKSAIFAMAIAATAGQAWAEKPQPSSATLTLLSEINEVLANTADSEGLSQETLVQLAESVLWTNEPSVDIASSEPTLLSAYSGAKLTNHNGEIAYIAINTSAEESVVSFPDTYSMNVPADGFAIRLQNFGHNFSILEFGGEIIVDGSDFLIATPGAAIELPYVGDTRTYSFSDDGMRIDSQNIFVNGTIEIVGTDTDDTFDFSGLGSRLEKSIYIDGRDGTDSVIAPNFDTIIYIGSNQITGFGLVIENIEIIAGGEGQNTLHGTDTENTWQISGTDAGTIITNSGSEVSFQNFGTLVGGNEADTFNFSSNGVISGNLNGGNGSDVFSILNDFNFTGDSNVITEGNTANLSSPHFSDNIQVTNSSSVIVGDVSFTENNSITLNEIDETILSGTADVFIIQQGETDTIEEDPTTSAEDTTSEDSIESDASNEKVSTDDESGGGSFNLFSLLIFGFLSLVHIRKTKNGK